jgi:hypothetical protein
VPRITGYVPGMGKQSVLADIHDAFGSELDAGQQSALIVDEFALLLDLKDVYWAKEGRVSVDVGIGGSSLVASYFAGLPVPGP